MLAFSGEHSAGSESLRPAQLCDVVIALSSGEYSVL